MTLPAGSESDTSGPPTWYWSSLPVKKPPQCEPFYCSHGCVPGKLEWLDIDMEKWTCLTDSMVCFYRRWITEQSLLKCCYQLYSPHPNPKRTPGNGEWKLVQTQQFILGKQPQHTGICNVGENVCLPKLTCVCVCVCVCVSVNICVCLCDCVLLMLWRC